MIEIKSISEEKKDIVKNLYISGISEEFIAMQIDLEIPVVIAILKELGVYKLSEAWILGASSQVFNYLGLTFDYWKLEIY